MNGVALSLLVFLLCLVTTTNAQSCNTDQNPYCRGNKKFEAICCPYPNVCYWADRQGTPACCPAGQSCAQAGGGVITAEAPESTTTIVPAPVETTEQETTQQETTQQETQKSYTTITTTVTTTEGGVFKSATSEDGSVVVGAATTVVQIFNEAPAICMASYWGLFTVMSLTSLWLLV